MTKTVQKYYESFGSRIGYKLLLKGSQHFGYYPVGLEKTTSEQQAQKNHHDLLAKHLELKPGMKVLDAGCGQGFVSCDIAKRYQVHVTGIDITPYIIGRAKKRAYKLKLENSTKYIVADYHQLPFPNNTFDRVYTVETLCHANDLSQALSELKRVLKPGGKIVFMEYLDKEQSEFTPKEQQIFEIVAEKTFSPSLDLLTENSFIGLLEKLNFLNIKYLDISDNMAPSVKRLSRIAKIPFAIFKFLRVEKKFINTFIGAEFSKLYEKKLLGYAVYEAWK